MCLIAACCVSHAQSTKKLQVFIDCSNTWCDEQFIRTEINVVDFLLDRLAADVHLLITRTNNGAGGSQYQLIVYGQGELKSHRDTIKFEIPPVSTDFEIRDQIVKHIKRGLTPLVLKTDYADHVQIKMKLNGDTATKTQTTDRWNYWVYRISTNGDMSSDQNYQTSRIRGRLSANRTTDVYKTEFSTYGSSNRSVYEYEDNGALQKVSVDNTEFGLYHYLAKSLNEHWSLGYETGYNNNTFANNKSRVFFRAALEFNIFPYKDFNNKLLTISYGPDVRRNRYYDTTIFQQTEEVLWGHTLMVSTSYNQKWGSLRSGVAYHNYFHDWSLANVGMQTEMDIRITGGLSFYTYMFGGIVRDQVYLPAEGATSEEVLTRRRQLASNYLFEIYFGISYRFGSKLNNFVNPRFEGMANQMGTF